MAIEIKIEYFYYSTKRIIPAYIVEEELMTLEYSKYVERNVNEVPHLRRINSMRLTVKEDETVSEVDLGRKYFSLQMKGLPDNMFTFCNAPFFIQNAIILRLATSDNLPRNATNQL